MAVAEAGLSGLAKSVLLETFRFNIRRGGCDFLAKSRGYEQ